MDGIGLYSMPYSTSTMSAGEVGAYPVEKYARFLTGCTNHKATLDLMHLHRCIRVSALHCDLSGKSLAVAGDI
jgi:hypothetical protein